MFFKTIMDPILLTDMPYILLTDSVIFSDFFLDICKLENLIQKRQLILRRLKIIIWIIWLLQYPKKIKYISMAISFSV